jgi:hypothetical protein
MRVRIKKNPGSLNPDAFNAVNPSTKVHNPDISVRKTLGPVPRKMANLEAEKGETVHGDINQDSLPEFYSVGGKKHSQGGTPLALPDTSFIFSDDPKMIVEDPEILKMFGKTGKKVYTPAQLSKIYDINNYRKTLQDPDSDKMQVKTAERMIENYNQKLGKLALYQESMKGFPNGIPDIALPYMEKTGITPEVIFGIYQTPEERMQYAKTGGEVVLKLMQKAGQVKTNPRENVYGLAGEEYLKKLASVEGIDYESSLPYTFKNSAEFTRPHSQSLYKGTKNIYGDRNWWEGKDREDFQRRHADYLTKFKEKSGRDFNPENKDDVNDFQTTYNEYAKTVGLPAYFSEKGKPGTGYDKLFGEHTWSAPSLSLKKAKVPEVPTITPENKNPDIIPDYSQPEIMAQYAAPEAQYWLQDIVKTAGAFNDLNRVKKYMPWVPGYQPVLPDPTFYDPTRQLAAVSEQAAMAQNANAAFAGPQATYRNLAVQSNAAKQAADTLSQYNNMNVGVANQFESQRASMLSQSNQINRQLKQDLYDRNTIANQQFDNAKNQARQQLRQSYIDAITNRANAQVVNSMYENYAISPLSGGMLAFTHGRNPYAKQPYGNDLMQDYQTFASYNNVTPEIAWQMAQQKNGVPSGNSMVNDQFLQNYMRMLSGVGNPNG